MLESVETGYHDSEPGFEAAMQNLAEAIAAMSPGDEPKDLNLVLDVLAFLRTSRYLRILQLFDENTPGAASKVIAAAEKSKVKNEGAQIFLKRNIIFERFRLMPRVLSKERLDLIVDALGA